MASTVRKLSYALAALVAIVVVLFANTEILDAVMDDVCPSTHPFYIARSTTAASICCTQDLDSVTAPCSGATNTTAPDNMFGGSTYAFINSIIPLFGIISVFGALFIVIRQLRKV